MFVQINHTTEDEQHILLDLFVPYLRIGSDIRNVQFKIISSPKWFGLEFRNSRNTQGLFSIWPGTESDRFGAKFLLGLDSGLGSALAKVCPQDTQFLGQLFGTLREILLEVFGEISISYAGQKKLLQGVQEFLALGELRELVSAHAEADVVSKRHGNGFEAIAAFHTDASRKNSQSGSSGPRKFLPPNLSEFFMSLHVDRLRPVSYARNPIPDHNYPVVISVVRNEMALIGEYFDHYRRAGIRRFAIIDNDSTDGTLNFVSSQPDADVYSCTDQFSTVRKQGWINQIILRYGYARWYLIADADEHIVFDGIEEHGFDDLVLHLESQRRRVARGMLVDMYGDRPLDQLSGAHEDLRRELRFFDAGPYVQAPRLEMMSCRGGMRRRVFSALDSDFDPELTKYPLFKLDPGEFVVSPHYIWPPGPHLSDPCVLGILHYKFTKNHPEKVADAVARRQYWSQSAEYLVYQAALNQYPGLVIKSGESAEYESSESIRSLGLIQNIEW